MFAGEFAAGARAFEGQVGEVYLRLIGFASAALAFAPEGYFIGAFGDPFGGSGEVLAGFPGGVIGCEGKNLFFGEVQGSVRWCNKVGIYERVVRTICKAGFRRQRPSSSRQLSY